MDQEMLDRLGVTPAMLDKARREIERDTIYSLYQKFGELKAVCGREGKYLSLCISSEDEGSVRDWGDTWCEWSTAEKGIEAMEQEIQRIMEEQR